MGEVVHGDYRKWANPETLDSVTNYVCFKGLYSSHVDRNYFEIAYSLNRQFGERGLYCDMPLYNFADNHDVNRVASNLTNPAHLYTLYCLLFTIPASRRFIMEANGVYKQSSRTGTIGHCVHSLILQCCRKRGHKLISPKLSPAWREFVASLRR